MGVPTKQKKIKPATSIPYASALLCEATEVLAKGDIVYISGMSGASAQVTKARADSAVTSGGTLLIAKNAVPSGGRGIFLPWQLVTGLNTNGRALGDKVFLSAVTAGGYVYAPDTGTAVRRQVGTVRAVSATEGMIEFNFADLGEEIAGASAGLSAPAGLFRIVVPAGSIPTITVFEGQIITDIWAVITTGGTTENLVVTQGGDTVLSQATGTVSADDIVRATTLDTTYESIAAGAFLSATFDGATIAGVVYISTIKVP